MALKERLKNLLKERYVVQNGEEIGVAPLGKKRKLEKSGKVVERNQKVSVLELEESQVPRKQWPLKTTNVREAWKFSQGEGVVIAIPDSGLDYTHREFQPLGYEDVGLDLNYSEEWNEAKRLPLYRQIIEGKNPAVAGGKSFLNDTEDFWDTMRHGTAVASIACARGRALWGVAPRAKLMIYRIVNHIGWSDLRLVALSLKQAIEDKVDIVSFSLAFPLPSRIVESLVEQCERENILVIAAAGNRNAKRKFYPAATRGVLAVGGCNSSRYRWVSTRWKGSSYGEHLNLVAPADAQPVCRRIRSRYVINEGTSLAAPHVAGIAALILSLFKRSGVSYSTALVKQILIESCFNREILRKLPYDVTGDGKVDISDLIAVGRAFGKEGETKADVNQDGKVDILDLSLIGRNLGATRGKGWTESVGFGVPDAAEACRLAVKYIEISS